MAEVALAAEKEGISYLETVKRGGLVSPANEKKLAKFLGVAESISDAMGRMSPVDFMQYVITESGLEAALKTSEDPDDRNRYENIEGLVGAVKNFVEDNPEATMSDFMQSVSLVSDSDGMDDENYVTVATIHAVKGLEFDNVFIIGLEEGVFPTSSAVADGDVEEERRLMYVAVTRAKRRLYVLSARSRFRFGRTENNPKSRFISEMRGDKTSIRVSGAFFGEDRKAPKKPVSDFGKKASPVFVSAPARRADAPDFSEFVKGAVVEHRKFGRGVVRETVGEGENKTAAIEFEGLGVKRFALSIAVNSMSIVKEGK